MSERPEAMRVEYHPGVQGLSQLGRNAIDRVIELEQARARDNMAFKQLLSQRDALLEALKEIHQATMRNGIVLAKCVGINAVAGMAIAKVEGMNHGQD